MTAPTVGFVGLPAAKLTETDKLLIAELPEADRPQWTAACQLLEGLSEKYNWKSR